MPIRKFQIHCSNVEDRPQDHDYDVILSTPAGEGTLATLFRSQSSEWSHPGEKVLEILDNGNGYKILHQSDSQLSGKVTRQIQYHELSELFILLAILNRSGSLDNPSAIEVVGDLLPL
jgi:hypothetical protein